MMKEFGVKFYIKGFLDVESDFLEKELGFHLEIRTLYNKLCQVNLKIYVAQESEHIFEPKEDDLILHSSPDSDYDAYKLWKSDIGSVWLKKYFSKTIMRDNKQFFMPEVEND